METQNISQESAVELTSVYLDYHASTPVDPRVLEKMLPYFLESFGNSSSRSHRWGWASSEGVEVARKQIASALDCMPKEIVFTSGGTEANNLALLGLWRSAETRNKNIVVSAVEHASVPAPARYIGSMGGEVRVAPVDSNGHIILEELSKLLDKNTLLVSVIYANNEVGTIQRMKEISKVVHSNGSLFHTDAVQAFGKFEFSVKDIDVDLLSISSHKIYGPKGAGALYIRKKSPRIKLTPLQFGGGHELGLRAGTLNTPAIVGFGEAAHLAIEELGTDQKKSLNLKERFFEALSSAIPGIRRNGDIKSQTCLNLSLTLPEGVTSQEMMKALPEIAFSAGSACSSANPEPSPTLMALGISQDEALRTVRFSFGRFTTPEEVDFASQKVVKWWKSQRS